MSVKSDFESPRSRFTETPKTGRTALKEFFDSPMAQKRILAEKMNHINKLNRQLMEEQSENADLQETVQSLQKEVSALKGVIEEKAIQINTLKLELLEKTESCDQTENSACTIKESLLKNEIKDLQMYISHVESDITNIKEELKSTTHKLRCAEKENDLLKCQCVEIEKNYEASQENIRLLEDMLSQAQKICKDQGDCIQALEKQSVPHITESPVHINFTSPENFHTLTEENLGKTVVDLVLQETKNEIKELEETINMLKTEINDNNLKISTQEEIIESQELVLNDLKNEKACISESVKMKQNEVEFCKEELLSKNLIISDLQDENAKLKNEQDQLREDMNDKLLAISDLQSINKQFQQSVCDNLKKIRDLENQINLLKVNLNTVTQDVIKTITATMEYSLIFKDSVDTKVYNLNEFIFKSEKYMVRVDKMSNEIKKLKIVMSESNAKLISVQNENEILKDNVLSKTKKLNDLTKELNDKDLLINSLQTENKNILLFQNKLLSDTQEKDREILELVKIKQNLDDEVNNKMEEVIKLQQNLQDCQTDLDNAISKIDSILSESEGKIYKLRHEINELNSRLEDTLLVKEQICSEKLKLECEIICKNKSLSELENEISTLKSEKIHLEQQMTEKESVLSVLSDQIAAMKLEKGIAEKQLIDKDSEISVLGNRLSGLELEKAGIMEEMHELQKEISIITDKYNIKCSKVDDLTQVLNNRELLINNLKIENENLLLYQNNLLSEAQRKDKEILELTKIKMNMKDEINNKEEEVISLQQKLRDSKIHLDCALTKIGSISSENEDKISKLRDEIVELRSHLDDTVLIKEQIYSEKVKLEKEIMCKNNSLSELENEISTLKLDKVRFDQLLAEQELEVGILSDQIIAIKLEKEEAEKQLINKDSEVSALAKKLSEFELEETGIIEKVHELEKEISIITDKCNSKCFEVDRLTKEINAKELLINCLQNENKNLILCQNNVLSELQTELLESKETIRNLEETLSNKELVINKAVFENKELKKQKDLISTEMKIMRQSKILIENELKNKHKVLKQYDQKIENLENNTDKLTLNLNKLSKENVELTNKLMESTNKLGEMDFERTKLTEKLSLSDSKINELNALCNEYKEKVNTLETKQEEMYAVYKDTKSKYVLLKQEITVIENENELLMNKKTQLSAALCEANNIMKVQGSKIEESNLLKEAYNKLVEDNDRLQDENKQLTERLDDVVKEKEQIGTKSTTSLQLHEDQIRNDYEQRLQHAKNQMKAVYNTQKIKIEEQKTKELQQYKDKIQRDQDHIAELSSQLWNTNDRLLTLKQENEDLKSMLQHSRLQTYELPDRRTLSLDQICLPSRRKENTEVLEIIDETITRRHSTRVVPSGMGKVFPSEDEQGEVFNNTYLADLKAGRCIVDNSDRISTLQYRNSLCPPHLKSSYPAETQFLATEKIKEDEIKGGLVTSDKENLLPGEKTRKKDKNQISYKKPGPPTPSKNGGRQLLQNVTEQLQLVTPRGILRENNSEKHRPRVSTPARIKALFTGRRKDENVTTTPKTRKSLFFQKH